MIPAVNVVVVVMCSFGVVVVPVVAVCCVPNILLQINTMLVRIKNKWMTTTENRILIVSSIEPLFTNLVLHVQAYGHRRHSSIGTCLAVPFSSTAS
jgi:hypothetical protein